MPDMPSHHAPTTTTVDLPMQVRAAEVMPASYSADAGTIDVVWTTGARGVRYDWSRDEYYDEELSLEPGAVDLVRMQSGCAPALDSHDSYSLADIIGVVVAARIEGGQGIATVRLSVDPAKAGRVADIVAGIIRSISVGYIVQSYERIEPEARADGGKRPLLVATRWTPHEISFVAIPFDTGCATRAADPHAPAAAGHQCVITARSAAAAGAGANTTTGGSMPQTIDAGSTAPASPAAEPVQQQCQAEPAAPAARTAGTDAAEIISLCRTGGLGLEHAEAMLREGLTPDQASRRILQQRAADDRAAGGHLNVTTTRDEGETRLRGIEEALMHRLDSRAALTDNGRQYRSLSLIELGREHLAHCGVNTRGMDRHAVASAMLRVRSAPGFMSTSDFGFVFGSVSNRRLRAAYEANAPTYSIWARRAPNAPDFRDVNVGQISTGPELADLNEAGEYTYGAYSDSGLSYRVVTGGRIVAITRQMIVNDDLRAFDRVISQFGAAAARRENRMVYGQLTGAPKMSDGKALFDPAHKNSVVGALTLESLRAARMAMRKQVGMAGPGEPAQALNLSARYLLVPTDLETEAGILTSANYQPTTRQDTNEFAAGQRSALTMVVDPILDASPAAWMLLADSSQVDTVEYAYLDGAEGPVIEQEVGFEVDGLQIKCRHDFAARAIDWRGMVRAAPAA